MSAITQKLMSAAVGETFDPYVNAWTLNSVTKSFEPFGGIFYIGNQETTPTGVFFKPDGTKMYVIGSVGDDINEYDLSTAWDISTASYVRNFRVAAQETAPTDLFFKPDGTKMYVSGGTGDDINEYSLSTAWDVSTASYVQNFSVTLEETNPNGLFFKPDGTKMYVLGATGDDINEYNLSTAWDISTASYFQNFSVAGQETAPHGLFFKPDGTKMYIIGQIGDDINEYSLSTAWDVSTASYVQNFSVADQDNSPTGIFFKDDGTEMFMIGLTSDAVYKYTLNTAWDISTASWVSPTQGYFYIGTQEITATDLFFKPDGTKMYVIGFTGDDVNEYDLSTAWNISTASYVQNFSINAQETIPVGLFFKPDGTKMYVIGSVADSVNEYDLSTAWNVSTASFVQSFSIAAQENSSTGVFFKPDGTKMYVIGNGADHVNEYDLSTAWNISTASYLQRFTVAFEETNPQGVFFKDDGTKMFVIGDTGNDVNEYSLSTAWDVSTASYVQNFSVTLEETTPQGLFFKDDGSKMYVIGNASDAIWEYNLI